MSAEKRIAIEYFSDVLCVWAYGAQIRLDRLKHDFGDRVQVVHRFLPLFAATAERMHREWGDRGGFTGYNRHVRDVVAAWQHIEVHPRIWLEEVPASSVPAHLFLKAVQLLEQRAELGNRTGKQATSPFEAACWRVRRAFFGEARNVARQSVLEDIGRSLELPLPRVWGLMENGEAHAALHIDFEAKDRYHVPGSPTLVLNEGRQRLYGNVGYRVIEANVHELLRDPRSGEASWC
jgi:predicted DsbA family dithiol-disulfide isomerase